MEKLIVFLVFAVVSILFKSGGKQNNKQSSNKRSVNVSDNRNQQSFDNHRYQVQGNGNQANKKVNAVKAESTHKAKIQSEKQVPDSNKTDSMYGDNSVDINEYYTQEDKDRDAYVSAMNNPKKSMNNETYEESISIDITIDLQRSIIASEILGPPRAIKKSIR